jgi:hypothetical protein
VHRQIVLEAACAVRNVVDLIEGREQRVMQRAHAVEFEPAGVALEAQAAKHVGRQVAAVDRQPCRARQARAGRIGRDSRFRAGASGSVRHVFRVCLNARPGHCR